MQVPSGEGECLRTKRPPQRGGRGRLVQCAWERSPVKKPTPLESLTQPLAVTQYGESHSVVGARQDRESLRYNVARPAFSAIASVALSCLDLPIAIPQG